jgi:hypothetical protein
MVAPKITLKMVWMLLQEDINIFKFFRGARGGGREAGI